MDRPGEPSDEREVARTATHWLQTLPHAGTEGQRRFGDWLLESPKHVQEFLLATAFHMELARQHDAALSVDSVARSEHRAVARWPWMAAASVLVASVAAVLMFWPPAGQKVTTAVGERKELILEDGSHVHLNTASAVEVAFARRMRGVRLLQGEALFNVRKDTSRRFSVAVGDNRIEAIGTEFTVHNRGGKTLVWVSEGTVQLVTGCASDDAPTPALHSGHQALIANVGCPRRPVLSRLTAEEMARRHAWLRGALMFHEESLASAVAEVNRYNERQIVLVDPELAGRTIGGYFSATDPDTFVKSLENLGLARVERSPDPPGGLSEIHLYRP